MYNEKVKTWKDNWHDIIRYDLFQDSKLKDLMMIPKDVNILRFIQKYFIETADGGELLTDEKVRIHYYDPPSRDTRNKNIKFTFKEFDIYVKNDCVHGVTSDMLQCRYDLIAERLRFLLTRDEHVHGFHFQYIDAYPLWTKTPGYKRYHVIFSYKKTV